MKRMTLVLTLLMWAVLGYSAAVAQDYGGSTDTLQGALENNRTNQASTWVNPDTGDSEAVVPVRTYENAQGGPCREFQRTIVIGGKKEQGYGTACRQPDGSWSIFSGQTAAAPTVERRTTVYVREVPRPYYSYPYPYYPYSYYPYGYYAPWGYGYPFSFSFGYIYHDGGHHHGGGHHGGGYHRSGGGHYGGGHRSGGHHQWGGGGRHR
jgi:surface antigen